MLDCPYQYFFLKKGLELLSFDIDKNKIKKLIKIYLI